jgi:hypothetical protein
MEGYSERSYGEYTKALRRLKGAIHCDEASDPRFEDMAGLTSAACCSPVVRSHFARTRTFVIFRQAHFPWYRFVYLFSLSMRPIAVGANGRPL